MARVVCQVLAGSDRLTLLWSEGSATFTPYVIEGSALAELHRLSQLAHQQLAQLTLSVGDAAAMTRGSFALAQTGHALYRALFQLDQQGETPGQEVRNWLDGLALQGAVERLEIVGDCFTLPWAAVYDQPPDQAAFTSAAADGACLKSFWGRRFPLMGGRRVQWLRGRQLPEKPAVVLAIDPGMRGGLPPEEQKRLSDFKAGHDVIVVESVGSLAKIFQTQEVDLLYVCGYAEGNAVQLGEHRLTADSLANIVFGESNDEDAPSGQTLVFLNAVAGGSETGNLLAAFERFSAVGLMGPIQPLQTQAANCCGLDLLGQIIAGGQ
ncbi:MAG TPA: hypothetical protein VE988_09300, partial [Gemmataceae bacterium]|nr:hypothetical protein [Gemmataceae bacterium]